MVNVFAVFYGSEIRIYLCVFYTHSDVFERKNISWLILPFFANFEAKRGRNGMKNV